MLKTISLLWSFTLVCVGPSVSAAEAHPFPQHVPYAAGTIFPTNYSQTVQDNDVRNFYNAWKSAYVVNLGVINGTPQYRIAFGKSTTDHARTVSEGQGYGMVIVALMAGHDPEAKTIFDGLHAFALAHPSTIDNRLMAWEIPSPSGVDSAFDGDADIAYALTIAASQWGGTAYTTAANTRLAGILATTIGPQSRLPTLGDWVGFNDAQYNQYCPRSSDIMPGHFRSWARFTGNVAWNTVANNCGTVITAIQANYSPSTGLLPGFIINANPPTAAKPSGANYLEAATDGMYDYNAGRDPWRIGMDALLNGNATSRTQALAMTNWAKIKTSGNPLNLKAPYTLAGTPTSTGNGFSTFFSAPFGVAAMLDAANQAWLNAIYASVRTTHEDYFEDSVTLQCLLAMTGNYWDPTTIGGTPPADAIAPTIPLAVVATGMSVSTISITWTASTDNVGVIGYEVYRGATKINSPTTTSFTDTGLTPSTLYSYTVKARDAAGNVSAASTAAAATTLADTSAPSVPSGFGAPKSTTSSATLTWTASTDNIGVSSYDVYRNGVLVGNSTTTTYTDTGLAASTTYTYTLKAKDAAGNASAASAPVSVATLSAPDTTAPSIPTGVTATASSVSSITVTWIAATDNVAVIGYDVYRGAIKINAANVTGLDFTDTGLTPSTLYGYTVKARDAANNISSASSVGTATTLPDTTAPSAPAGFGTPVVSNTSVIVTWSPSTDNVGIAKYYIYRDGILIGSSTGTSFTNSGLTESTTYIYIIKAEDAAGNLSAASSPITVTTLAVLDTTPPSVPTGISPSVISSNSITIIWNSSSDAVGVAGYDIYRGATKIGSVTGTNFTDTGLTASTAYIYTVKSRDAAGNTSASSSAVTITTSALGGTEPPDGGGDENRSCGLGSSLAGMCMLLLWSMVRSLSQGRLSQQG